VPEDDSTSDCINGIVECLCLDLVAEAAHLTHCAALFRFRALRLPSSFSGHSPRVGIVAGFRSRLPD